MEERSEMFQNDRLKYLNYLSKSTELQKLDLNEL
jgi:hypothetical protein